MKRIDILMIWVLLLFFFEFGHSIQLDIPPLNKRCITNDFRQGQLIQGSLSVPYSDYFEMSMEVTSPGNDIVEEKKDFAITNFALNIDKDGTYTFCFKEDKRPTKPYFGEVSMRRVSITLVDQNAFNLNDALKKEKLKPIDLLLRQSEQSLNTIESEFKALRRGEELHRDTSETMNARIPFLSLLTIFILLALGVWQIYHLRNYITSKTKPKYSN